MDVSEMIENKNLLDYFIVINYCIGYNLEINLKDRDMIVNPPEKVKKICNIINDTCNAQFMAYDEMINKIIKSKEYNDPKKFDYNKFIGLFQNMNSSFQKFVAILCLHNVWTKHNIDNKVDKHHDEYKLLMTINAHIGTALNDTVFIQELLKDNEYMNMIYGKPKKRFSDKIKNHKLLTFSTLFVVVGGVGWMQNVFDIQTIVKTIITNLKA